MYQVQNLSSVEFALSSPFRAVRIARKLSGFISAQIQHHNGHNDPIVIDFYGGFDGFEDFAAVVCAGAEASGWRWFAGRDIVRFRWEQPEIM